MLANSVYTNANFSYSSGSARYRYGFQGQEKDDAVKGAGNSYNFKYRMYDPRLGRFFSIDPLTAEYPYYSPFIFSGNRVIDAIEVDGLEAHDFTVNNVQFVLLTNVSFQVVKRGSNETLTKALNKTVKPDMDNYSLNLNFFGLVDKTLMHHYFIYPFVSTPQPLSNYTIEGRTVGSDGKAVFGIAADTDRAFFTKENGKWKAGIGNTPLGKGFGFGGGVPVYVDGKKYGSEEIKDENGNVIQSQARGWDAINGPSDGKSILGYNSNLDMWVIVSQDDGADGLTLDNIRDRLIASGFDNIIAFDGGSSATLIKNKVIKNEPAGFKNNQIPTGITLSVPKGDMSESTESDGKTE